LDTQENRGFMEKLVRVSNASKNHKGHDVPVPVEGTSGMIVGKSKTLKKFQIKV
jgi:hypothetical protein